MDLTQAFAPIAKTVEQDDGSLLVYGKATDDSLDLDEQRCDAGWLKMAMPAWFGTGTGIGGNIRAQHRADSAVGKAIEHEAAADGHYITAKIVDREAIAKTRAGVFTGFSIGIRRPKIVKSDLARNGVINGGTITEISLVDRPANSNAILTLCKAASEGWEGAPADLDEERGLVKCEELVVDKAADTDTDAPAAPAVETPQPAQAVADEPLSKTSPADEPVFDRDEAVALVKATVTKAGEADEGNVLAGIEVPPTAPPPEMDDMLHAKAAIALIGQLIQSEAINLATRPYEDCDILLLMEAVQALRCFICREKMQPGNGDNDILSAVGALSAPLNLAADVDAEKAKYDAEQLRAMLASGKAMRNPDGDPSYPIGDEEDLNNAIHAVGRGKGDHSAIRAHIKKRAKALGKSNLIPDSWSGSSKTTDSEETKMADGALTNPDADLGNGKALDGVEPEPDTSKTVEPDAEKAAGFDPDVLVKALTGALAEEDSPLRKMFVDIVEASAEATVETLGDLGKRLAQVEQMATPGGPSLRRTEADRNQARKSDLVMEAARFKTLATVAEDLDLRKGYATKAAQLEAEIKAIA